jgi:hypothetical protein
MREDRTGTAIQLNAEVYQMFNRWILRMEGLAVLALSAVLYGKHGFSWGWFVLLLTWPDLSALGYLAGKKTGAAVYNLFHTYSLPAALLAAGWVWNQDLCLMVGLIWTAHIGMDRMLGFGLKYPSDFKDTHLQRV